MVVPAVVISTFLGAINGYILTKWRFKGDNIIFLLFLFGCFIPYQAILLPMARTLGALGISNSIRAKSQAPPVAVPDICTLPG